MADLARLATPELPTTPDELHEPMSTAPQVTSVANPRRIRLTRLAPDHQRGR
jgi:hypothetical protein